MSKIGLNKENQIEFILSDFNFMEIIEYMNFKGLKVNGQTPNEDILKNLAKKCLIGASNAEPDENGRKYHSIGKFEAEEINGGLELKFIMEMSNILPYLSKYHSQKEHQYDKGPARKNR